MFYEEQPVDWLMSYFRLSMGQRTVYLRKPTLFQHIGLKSSFDITKDNPLKDRYFDSGNKAVMGDNPPAVVLSPMPNHKENVVDMAYSSGSGFFWAKHVSTGDAIYVIFEQAVVLQRVMVLTGSMASPDDRMGAGSILLGASVSSVDATSQSAVCNGLVSVGSFVNGTADVQNLNERITTATACVIVRSDETLDRWVVFSQIAVFVVK